MGLLDSSWHGKSENRAGLSVLCSVDTQGHMLPGEFSTLSICDCSIEIVSFQASMFISANVKEATMFRFIEGTHKKVEARARAIVAGMSQSSFRIAVQLILL